MKSNGLSLSCSIKNPWGQLPPTIVRRNAAPQTKVLWSSPTYPDYQRMRATSGKKRAKQNWDPRLGWKDEVHKVAPQRPDIFQHSMATRCIGLRDLKVGSMKAEPSHRVRTKLAGYETYFFYHFLMIKILPVSCHCWKVYMFKFITIPHHCLCHSFLTHQLKTRSTYSIGPSTAVLIAVVVSHPQSSNPQPRVSIEV